MRVFLDASVVLRLLFGEAEPLAEWSRIERAWGSRLLPVEIGRTIDRARLGGHIDDADVAHLHTESRRVLRSVDLVALTDAVLLHAAGPMPTVLGTLDALHLCAALAVARAGEPDLVLATHDAQLARAARASGLPVIGASG